MRSHAYTLSLHDALPISQNRAAGEAAVGRKLEAEHFLRQAVDRGAPQDSALGVEQVAIDTELGVLRSEEHTSELQSPDQLVCRLLLEKKNLTVRDRRHHS